MSSNTEIRMSLQQPKRHGRVIRRYRRYLPVADFPNWQDLIRSSARGCGLYALYDDERLIYVGRATKSIRSRIQKHISRGEIPFTKFSVFLVIGKTSAAQARRIRDLEALLLNVIQPTPQWNKSKTNFVAASRLVPSNAVLKRKPSKVA